MEPVYEDKCTTYAAFMGKIRLLEKKTSAVLQEVERGNLVELDGGGGYGVVRHIIGRVPGKEDQTCSLK